MAGASLLGGSATAAGPTGTISIKWDTGNYSSLFSGPGVGGEFQVLTLSDPSNALSTMDVSRRAGGAFFQTFCGQLDEDIYQNTVYSWSLDTVLSDGTLLQPGTAAIFQKFWDGTLAYDFNLGPNRAAAAKSVQLAIWKMQGQLGSPSAYQNDYNNDPVAIGLYNTYSGASGTGNVKVLVLKDGATEIQDLLVVIPNGNPSLTLTKAADKTEISPFGSVTYTYVLENTGGVAVDNIVVKDVITDDHGTVATGDDTVSEITIDSGFSLAAGATKTWTLTQILPVTACATVNSVPHVFAGTFITTVMPPGTVIGNYVVPAGPGDLKVTYIQSQGLNDNRYGTGATVATGWNSAHTFSNLTGSDKLEFRFKNKSGATVLDFYMDTISAVASETFPSGVATYPTGYGTRGANGAEGSLVAGTLSNVLLVQTSISENLKKPQFAVGYLVNSPPETAPLSGISVPAGWDYKNSYTAYIKGSTFGANGLADFGSVEVPDQHNSPAKVGAHQAFPEPCESEICNIANVTGTANGSNIPVTASSGEVCVKIIPPGGSGGGGGTAAIKAGKIEVKDKKLTIELSNTGSTVATIQDIEFSWPAANKKLFKVKCGKPTIFDTQTAPTAVSITTFKGKLGDRQIPAGAKIKITFEFEANANKDKNNYGLTIDFGAGPVTFIP